VGSASMSYWAGLLEDGAGLVRPSGGIASVRSQGAELTGIAVLRRGDGFWGRLQGRMAGCSSKATLKLDNDL
jgi:hypothetical protein